MSRRRNPNDLIRIEDAIKVLCRMVCHRRRVCHLGILCPDAYCKEMWDEFEDVERVEVVRCKDCKHSPLKTWFDCPMAHLPFNGDRWCWKGEREDGEAHGTK